MNIVIPAAGLGQRFIDAGYIPPKPLIPVYGVPMLERVIENLRPGCPHRVVVVSRIDSDLIWPLIKKNDIACRLTEPTEGAVDTILYAKTWITDEPLLIGNSDQLVSFNVNDFIDATCGYDGSFVTFRSSTPHHSYVRVDGDGVVSTIAEKVVISNKAMSGIYYFSRGTDFLDAARYVVGCNIRTRNEFYVSGVIQKMITDGKRFTTFDAPTSILGTPGELQLFEVGYHFGQEGL